MRVTLGPRTYDLTTRALVLGTVEGAESEGADLAEQVVPGDPAAVPLVAEAADAAAVDAALAAGAALLRLTGPTTADAYRRCAAAGVAVLVPAGAVHEARAAGLAADRVLPDTLLVDVTGAAAPLAVTVVAVIRGARIVRTDGARAARRVCDVLAAILEAGDQ